MSFNALARTVEDLPSSVKDSVLSYSRSVEVSIPEIFKDAQLKYRKELADQVVYVAGLKKLYSFVDSTYWMLDNSSSILEKQQVADIRIGGESFSRDSDNHDKLYSLRKNLIDLLVEKKIYDLVVETSYARILRRLHDERNGD